jgi:hypothetical protein
MSRELVPALLGGLATLFVALPLAAGAAADPAPLKPKRLVVDSVTAPVLSVDQAAMTVEIVLVPDGEYVPVHPDSIESDDESPATLEPTAIESDRP